MHTGTSCPITRGPRGPLPSRIFRAPSPVRARPRVAREPPPSPPAGAAPGAQFAWLQPPAPAPARLLPVQDPAPSSRRVAGSFPVTQWLNNFKRQELCTQPRLLTQSSSSKLFPPGAFSIQWEISINISNLQPGDFSPQIFTFDFIGTKSLQSLAGALNGAVRTGGRRFPKGAERREQALQIPGVCVGFHRC